MTQLVELQDAYPRIREAGVRLYAISYDDQEALRDFAETYKIDYPLLSDIDSAVIKRYEILNSRIQSGDAMLHGIPFPGAFVADEARRVVAKYFHDSYKKRTSPDILIDAAMGKVTLLDDEPVVRDRDESDINISATLHGGEIKQGAHREIVVRFELPEGLHIYDAPVPEGMQALQIEVTGPAGLFVEPLRKPETTRLQLEALNIELNVWSNQVDFCIPIWASSELVSECRALEKTEETLLISVRYQACDEETCLLPTSRSLELTVPLKAMHVQNLGFHDKHGQIYAEYEDRRHFWRLMKRKIKASPLGFLRFVLKSVRLELGAAVRNLRGRSNDPE